MSKKKKNLIYLWILLITLSFFQCGKKNDKSKVSPETSSNIKYWTCSMHPTVRSDKPGECPICGMDLIPVYKGDEDKIIVSEQVAKIVGIKSVPVEYKQLTKIIRLPGKVANDTELYLAQQEYLTSYFNFQNLKDKVSEEELKRLKKILNSAALKLKLLGFSEFEIESLKKMGEPDSNLIYPGEKVWVIADIFEYDLAGIKTGQSVTGTVPAFPGEIFYGTIKAIEPVLNPQTRTAKARIIFNNKESKLKLEMYMDITLKINFGKHLAIPKKSLIDTGTRKIVYLDLKDGRYKMQEIKTGFTADEYVQVISGLKLGDLVVSEGNFLLDSQATLTGGQSLLYTGSEEIKEKKVEKHQH